MALHGQSQRLDSNQKGVKKLQGSNKTTRWLCFEGIPGIVGKLERKRKKENKIRANGK